MSLSSAPLPDSNPSAPLPTLDGLPTEIKIRIVEECAAQDEKWGLLRDHLKECIDVAEGVHPDQEARPAATDQTNARHALEAVNRAYGSTISVLFRLSREWSVLAGPHRFKVRLAPACCVSCSLIMSTLQVIRTSQTRSLLFRDHILPQRSQLFRKVWFDSSDRQAFHDFVLILHQLSNVTEVVALSVGCDHHLKSSDQTDGLSWSALQDSSPFGLASFFSRLTFLRAEVPEMDHIFALACAAPNLRDLYLERVWAGEEPAFIAVLDKLPNLLHLSIIWTEGNSFPDLIHAITTRDNRRPPSLASFRLDSWEYISDCMRFASSSLTPSRLSPFVSKTACLSISPTTLSIRTCAGFDSRASLSSSCHSCRS
jgi:hypothetical protein